MEKKWVKFVAKQHNSATLIYDLNTMKGTVESYLKKHWKLFWATLKILRILVACKMARIVIKGCNP